MSQSNGILKVSTIDHITIVSSDFERSREFYVGLLGMEEVIRPSFSFPGRWFRSGETMIHLNPRSPEAGDPGWDSGASDPPRGPHIAFRVEDAADAAARLQAAGVKIEFGPRSRPDGAVQFYIRDPDGHLIEVCDLP
jgi:catechol 2,3-dioxygenase-like lactoylglutathione lyase family enzyme